MLLVAVTEFPFFAIKKKTHFKKYNLKKFLFVFLHQVES